MGYRDQTQLWIEQRQMEIYNQRAEWGLMNGKLLRENIKAGAILVRSTKQDSCWRQSRMLRYWKWEMKNLIRYPGYQIPRVREPLLNGIRYQGWGNLCQTESVSWWNWMKLAKDRLGPREGGSEEHDSSVERVSLSFNQIGVVCAYLIWDASYYWTTKSY